jgi:hypothetical protein
MKAVILLLLLLSDLLSSSIGSTSAAQCSQNGACSRSAASSVPPPRIIRQILANAAPILANPEEEAICRVCTHLNGTRYHSGRVSCRNRIEADQMLSYVHSITHMPHVLLLLLSAS